MKSLKISHIVVYVKDMETSIKFWSEKIGLKALFINEDWATFDAGGIKFALHIHEGPKPIYTGIIFETENIEKTYSELKSKGVKIETIQKYEWGYQTTFYDPEGNSYRIYQPL